MPARYPHFTSGISLLLCLAALALACTDPVDPEFQYQSGLIYIDAFASNSPGSSFAQVFESGESFGRQTNIFQRGAQVRFIRDSDGMQVNLAESGERYLPPEDFAVNSGEQWQLEVELADGRRYLSKPEMAVEPTEIGEVSVRYNPELVFIEDYDRRVPGHQLSVDFQDPPGDENYYFWQFRSYERLVYCQVCYGYTAFRDGICFQPNPDNPGPPLKEYYTYSCDEACWQIRYNESIEIFADEFADGTAVSGLPVANVLLYNKRNILVRLEQYALNREAFRYYKTLKDLVDNNSGFNAPLPAALLGNLYSPDDPEEYVLGRFTVAAQSSRNVFIDRVFIEGDQLEETIFGQAEEYGEIPVSLEPIVTSVPCEPGPYRTSVEPEGWPE